MLLNKNVESVIRPITRKSYKVLKFEIKESTYHNEFYTSRDYQTRLLAITKLAETYKGALPADIILDALKDPCSMIREFALHHFDYENSLTDEIENQLVCLVKDDERVHLRTVALDKLSLIESQQHYDLFFNSSLLKNPKEAAAGLRALAKKDLDKAYKIAKFRAATSKSDLDIAITDVFAQIGDGKDLPHCKRYCGERKNFYKIRYIPSYIRMLIKVGKAEVFKHHLDFMADDVKFSEKESLLPVFISLLQSLARDLNKSELQNPHLKQELVPFVNDLIDQLLETKVAPQSSPRG